MDFIIIGYGFLRTAYLVWGTTYDRRFLSFINVDFIMERKRKYVCD